jgi:hypothetical protein
LKAQIVAELLALWIETGSGRPAVPGVHHKLNELSFQCSLWLPKKIYEDLSKKLSHQGNAPDVKQILADVRIHLENDKIDPAIIINW